MVPVRHVSMEQITLSQILRELKLIERRVENRIQNFEPVRVIHSSEVHQRRNKTNKFESVTKETWGELRQLIERQRLLRSVLVVANARTIVEVQGKRFTISEAIEYKKIMRAQKTMCGHVRRKIDETKKLLQTTERKTEYSMNRLMHHITASSESQLTESDKWNDNDPFGVLSILTSPYLESIQPKVIYNQALSDSERDAITRVYKNEKMPLLFDPLGIEKSLDQIEHEANLFLQNVDVCISEVNAITIINLG